MEITTANGTLVLQVKKQGNDVESALKKAAKHFKSDNVILIQESIGALDAKTILDHSKYYYIAKHD